MEKLKFTDEEFTAFQFGFDETIEIYNQKRKEQSTPFQIIFSIALHFWVDDWGKLWDEFEDSCQMTFFSFEIGSSEFEFCDIDGQFFFNQKELYSYSEEDVFNKKLTTKLKAKVKKYISENQYQFDYLITSKKLKST